MTVQMIEIAGQQMAILPAEDYQRLIDMAEDRADERAAAEAQQRRENGEEHLPVSMLDRIIAGESALKVWRQHRAMTLASLAEAVQTGPSYLSELESGKRLGKPSLWRALADALRTSVDDILPEE